MNILILVDAFWPDHTGGISKSLLSEVVGLASRAHNIVVVTRKLNRDYPDSELREGYRLYRYKSPTKGTRFYHLYPFFSLNEGAKCIDSLHDEYHFDVAYVHNPFQAVGLLRCVSKIPYVYVFHAPTTREIELDTLKGKYGLATPLIKVVNPWIKGIERKALIGARRIIVRSRYMEDEMCQIHGEIGKDKTNCIPLCVDTNQFSLGNRNSARKELGLPLNRPILLTIRRLVARMGLENLVAAMSYVVKEIPEALLLIGGRGYLEEILRSHVIRFNLESNIKFVGFVPEKDLPKYHQAADLFVLPTEALEGFGLVILEALSCGTPVVATPVGAIPEVLGPLGDAFICKDASAEALADGIIEFVRKREDASLRKRCREYCEANFGIEKVVKDIERLLYEAAEK
ncbi:MAG: glycosyltransferase family 4 protein [Candidatus Methanosuratincola petrocarbonis]